MKHKHILVFNSINKSYIKYTYSFGNTDGVELRICKNGFQITAELTKIYDKEEMLSGNTYMFPDAIRKALLIYLLTYSKGLTIKSITFKIDDEEDTTVFDSEPEPPIYSMINGKLNRKLPVAFSSKPVIDFVLKTTKSNYGKMTAALFALITSKSKSYEIERFIYLWAAFNAMYGYFASIVKAQRADEIKVDTVSECNQIKYLLRLFKIGNDHIPKKRSKFIANNIKSYLYGISSDANREFFFQKSIVEAIENKLIDQNGTKYNITAYGYLLTQFSYYYRCNFFHGNKPVILFTYADDADLHCLKIVNNLLEEFIEEFLPNFLDNDYINNTLIPTARTITLK